MPEASTARIPCEAGGGPGAPLQRQVSARAALNPQATALCWQGRHMSHAELDRMSNQLASLLVDAGCPPGERVAVLMPRNHLAVVGLLGALKAGAIGVPVDTSDPARRIARILATADCRWLLSGGNLAPVVEKVLVEGRFEREPLLGWLDEEPSEGGRAIFELHDLEGFPATEPVIDKPPQLAQILFAPGATGRPRGVTLTHEGIAQFLAWARPHFGIDATSRVSQHASPGIGLATFEIFAALGAGAELHLVPAELNLLPNKLVRFIREAGLTHWLPPPALLNTLARYEIIREGDLPAMRHIVVAGEAPPAATVLRLMERLPHVTFTRLYGPSEITVASTWQTLQRAPGKAVEPATIGMACEGRELRVLDEQFQPVPDGAVGELCIGGKGVSPGYWRDPERTRAAFIEDPTRAGLRFYRTGERAFRDADGLHWFRGRGEHPEASRTALA